MRFLQCGLLAAVFWAPAAMGKEPSATEKWKQLSSEEQAKVLENYQEWQRLPRATRESLLAKYKEFHALSPEARMRIQMLWQKILAMPPEKRERLLKLNREKWRSLTPRERTHIIDELRQSSGHESKRGASIGQSRTAPARDSQTRGSKH
jgi:predicted Fe-S protein YdhL (DUF1289 family)